jgi:putative tryptophan/tyrosine transport system substrate-binding protein
MRRRDFIGTAIAVAAFPPLGVLAQQSQKIPKIGVLWHAGNAQAEGSNFPALVKGFSDLGYIDGRNIVLEHRFPNEVPAQFERLAAELVSLDVDVLVAIGANSAPYAKAATTKIPVVFAIVPDPLGSNLVKSLARPEANVTGFSNSANDLVGKRLELLKELIPELSRVALLVNSNSSLTTLYRDSFQAAASRLGLSGSTFTWLRPDDLESVFAAMKAADVQAVMINPDGWAFTYRASIAKFATANRLVLSSWSRQTFDAGAFMSYGVDHDAICRRVAVYVDKLLKGAKPGDLPVEQPTKFEFLVSLRAAKALGRDLPPEMLSRADEVFE